MKEKVVVIVGPTASGKTALSVELAKKIEGEIISSDSMQIYKDMDIGTAKVTKEEMQGIKHYLVDFVLPDKRYTVSDFKNDCEKALEEIISKGKTPIIVGGTGLYVDSIVNSIEYTDMVFEEKYRERLMEEANNPQKLNEMWKKASQIDPEAIKKISCNDKKRIIRILEIYKATGKTKTQLEIESRKKEPKYDFKLFGITMDREILYDRINRRVDLMIQNGLEDEVKNLLKKYKEFPTAMQGIGYKEVVRYLNNEISREEMINIIKQESRRYAKRQLTWFRRNEDIIWLDSNENTIQYNVEKIVEEL